MTKLPAAPFGIASTGGFSFVTVGGYTGLNELWVFRDSGLRPRLVRRIPLPIPGAAGEALTADATDLLVAAGSGVTVVDVARAERPGKRAVLGNLQAAPGSFATGLEPESAIEVAITPDSRYAFVSLEYAGVIAVFDLEVARAAGWARSGFRGSIPIGVVDVGLAVSPDGRTLFATRVVVQAGQAQPRAGELDVIDVRRAELEPATALKHRVPAGCDPVRVATAPDGKTVWVSARASNALLAFSASRLEDSASNALEHVVRVGEAPVGLVVIGGGRRVVVMNSNRFDVVGTRATLAVVDGRKGKLLGTIPAGAFPREGALTSDGAVLLVSDWGSRQLEAVDIVRLP